MDLQRFKEQGGCEGCPFFHVVDVHGEKECTFDWSEESDDWDFGKNCDEIAE